MPNALNEDVSYGFEVAAFTFLRLLWFLEPLKLLFSFMTRTNPGEDSQDVA